MLYHYLGPPALRALDSPTRRSIRGADDVADWIGQTGQILDANDEVTATFIVNAREELWIADRRSEHIACAQGGPVVAAGEMTFGVVDAQIEVVAVTNQSTGFCPQPQSWARVASVLDKLGLPHPDDYTAKFEFRRCDECDAINLVKDDWFVCAVCEAELSRNWNFGEVEN